MTEDRRPSFARQLSSWMSGEGAASDIVISSRVRLARNLDSVPFPPKMGREDALRVLDLAERATDHLENRIGDQWHFYRLAEVEDLDRWVLVEKHLISPQLVKSSALSGLILRRDEAVSTMVNEEDHLRIQCLFPGFNLRDAWRLADAVDDVLAEVVSYGFDDRMGYLTTCPTNVGTGMRVSVMVHLPGLVMTERLESVISGLAKVGSVVRGLYGEGSEAQGNLFQISNRLTLGVDEEEIIENLGGVVNEVVQRERSAREVVYDRDRRQLEDQVCRAYGLLTNARLMSSQEAMRLLSLLRLGIDLQVISGVSARTFQDLMIRMRPSLIQSEAGGTLDAG
ncbi:MAG: protein arginine kinase, partial [Bacillota bacterium]